ncbi:MAG: mechanosensitive ion channel domain-containing protein [Gammaproteobacteria bacterium]
MNNMILALKIILIIAAAYILYKGLLRLALKMRDGEILDEQSYIIFREIGKWILVTFTVLLLFHQFGIDASRILTALSTILVLLAIAFVAMWSVLSNILCALLLLFFSPFRFGDEIEIKEPDKERGIRGKVVGLSLFYTTLEHDEDNNINEESGKKIIRVPNIMFFQRVITCYEGKNTKDLRLDIIQHSRDQQS